MLKEQVVNIFKRIEENRATEEELCSVRNLALRALEQTNAAERSEAGVQASQPVPSATPVPAAPHSEPQVALTGDSDTTGLPAPARSEPHYLVTWMDRQCKAAEYEFWCESWGEVFFQRPSNIEGKIAVLGPIRLDWLIAASAKITKSPPTQENKAEVSSSGGILAAPDQGRSLPNEPASDGDLDALVERLHTYACALETKGEACHDLLIPNTECSSFGQELRQAASAIVALRRDREETLTQIPQLLRDATRRMQQRAEVAKRDAARYHQWLRDNTHPTAWIITHTNPDGSATTSHLSAREGWQVEPVLTLPNED